MEFRRQGLEEGLELGGEEAGGDQVGDWRLEIGGWRAVWMARWSWWRGAWRWRIRRDRRPTFMLYRLTSLRHCHVPGSGQWVST